MNNEKLREKYKIVNTNCIGVKQRRYFVFRDINSHSIGMTDTDEYHHRFNHHEFEYEEYDLKTFFDNDLKNSSQRMMVYRENYRWNMYCIFSFLEISVSFNKQI